MAWTPADPNWQPPTLAPYLRQQQDEPAQPQTDSNPAAHEVGERPKARVGTDGGGQSVWYDPEFPGGRLPNPHLSVTGESGSGKTQIMKNILAELRSHGVPALCLDFKDDYADPVYAQREGYRVYDPTKEPLPMNPLEPPANANKTFHAYQLAEIVSRIYGLGEIQNFRLRESIKSAYADAGDGLPTFDDVRAKLAADKANAELLGRLSPVFDFGLFSGEDPGALGRIVTTSSVIRLGQLPSNQVKNSVAEFFLMALYNYLIRQPQTESLRQVLVLDEAWRLVNSPFLEPLMRESRAFGLGVFVATQFPTDLPETVSGNTATKLYFSQSSPNQVTEIARGLTGSTSGTEAERLGTMIRSLKPLHCALSNKQYEPYVAVAADAYFARYSREASVTLIKRPSDGENLNLTKAGQSQGEPEYICPRCQSPVSALGGTCNSCAELVGAFDDTDASAQSLEKRIENAETGWDDGFMAKTAMVPYLPCPDCGSEEPPDSDGVCGDCGNIDDEWPDHPTGILSKTAELIPFPPGEEEEEGPFAPFSMSEWQMVKGPKHRMSAADPDCENCEGAGCIQCDPEGEDWDPTPRGASYRGTDGCTHLHYFPNVTPSTCAYCSGTE